MHRDVEEILFSLEEITKRCDELGKQISHDYQGKTPVIIGLLKGCVPFMAELIKHIDCDIQIDFFDVSSYDGVNQTGNIRILKDIETDVHDRDIIICEDIVDTGLTIKKVMELLSCRGATSVEVVTLFDKKEGRTVKNVTPKYIGYDVPKKFVVGFGLDYNELYRNLPYVGVLRRSVYEK